MIGAQYNQVDIAYPGLNCEIFQDSEIVPRFITINWKHKSIHSNPSLPPPSPFPEPLLKTKFDLLRKEKNRCPPIHNQHWPILREARSYGILFPQAPSLSLVIVLSRRTLNYFNYDFQESKQSAYLLLSATPCAILLSSSCSSLGFSTRFINTRRGATGDSGLENAINNC